MTSDQTHVIVGASLAGAKAAETLREEGFDGRLVLIGAEDERPYERPPLSKDYLRGEVGREKVYVHDEGFYAEHDIELRLGRSGGEPEHVEQRADARRRRAAALRPAAAHHRRRAATARDSRGELDGVLYLRSVAGLRRAARTARPRRRGGGRRGRLDRRRGGRLGSSARPRGHRPRPGRGPARARARRRGRRHLPRHPRRPRRARCCSAPASRPSRATRRSSASAPATGASSTATSSWSASASSRAPSSPRRPASPSTTASSSTSTSRPARPACSPRATWPTPTTRSTASTIRVEHWSNALHQGPAAARNMLGRRHAYDRLPYFFSDQYDVGMEYSGFARTWDRVVFRGDPAEPRVHRLLAGRGSRRGGHERQRLGRHRPDPAPHTRTRARRRPAPRRPRHPARPARAGEGGGARMNRLQALHDAGVSIWLDTLSRELLLDSGDFARADRRLRGHRRDLEPDDLRQGDHRLRPLRRPAPRCRRLRASATRRSCSSSSRSTTSAGPPTCCVPTYDASDGRDGFISFECTPDLADDTAGHDRAGARRSGTGSPGPT